MARTGIAIVVARTGIAIVVACTGMLVFMTAGTMGSMLFRHWISFVRVIMDLYQLLLRQT